MENLPSVVAPLLACVYAFIIMSASVSINVCTGHWTTARSSVHPVLSHMEIKEECRVKIGHICQTVCPLLWRFMHTTKNTPQQTA